MSVGEAVLMATTVPSVFTVSVQLVVTDYSCCAMDPQADWFRLRLRGLRIAAGF